MQAALAPAAGVIPMNHTQPEPISVMVNRERLPDGTWLTTVARLFAPGEAWACRLCPREACGAADCGVASHCLVTYYEFVPDDLAGLWPFGGVTPS